MIPSFMSSIPRNVMNIDIPPRWIGYEMDCSFISHLVQKRTYAPGIRRYVFSAMICLRFLRFLKSLAFLHKSRVTIYPSNIYLSNNPYIPFLTTIELNPLVENSKNYTPTLVKPGRKLDPYRSNPYTFMEHKSAYIYTPPCYVLPYADIKISILSF